MRWADCEDDEGKEEEEQGTDEEDERIQMEPNMGTSASCSRTTSDPGEMEEEHVATEEEHQHSEEKEETLRLLRGWQSEASSSMKWADCVEEKLGKQGAR